MDEKKNRVFKIPKFDGGKLAELAKNIDNTPEEDPTLTKEDNLELPWVPDDPEAKAYYLANEIANGADIFCTEETSEAICLTKLRDCRICRRTFPIDRVEIHEDICEKSKIRNRIEKQDLSKQPFEISPETLLREFDAIKLSILEPEQQCRYEKDVFKLLKYLPDSSYLPSEDYVQCPICGLRFYEDAFYDHYVFCNHEVVEEEPKIEVVQAPKVREEKIFILMENKKEKCPPPCSSYCNYSRRCNDDVQVQSNENIYYPC